MPRSPARKARVKLDPAEEYAAKVQHWQTDALAFFDECLGVRLSNQQTKLVKLVQDMVWAKIRASNRKRLGEREKRLAGKLGISVHSGRGLGKDFTVAGVLVWMLMCFRPFRGLVTAPSSKQLEDVMSTQIGKLIKGAKWPLWRVLEITRDRVRFRDKGDLDSSFVTKRTANVKAAADEQAEVLSGQHEKFMLMVADEASGLPDGVFVPLERTLTGFCNFAFLIGNVTRNSGYFFKTHYDPKDRGFWEAVRWNAEDSDMEGIAPGLEASVKRMLDKYGRESNPYRIDVLGLPPVEEENQLIPQVWINRAMEREIVTTEHDPLILGVDVGRGTDPSAMVLRRGGRVLWARTLNERDAMAVKNWVAETILDEEPDAVCIDSIGVGGPVCDFLVADGFRINFVNVAERSSHSGRFYGLRDELWWRVRERFEAGRVSLPEHRDMMYELGTLKVESWEPIKIESKKKAKARGVQSPNIADAIMHTFFVNDVAVMRQNQMMDAYEREAAGRGERRSWLTA